MKIEVNFEMPLPEGFEPFLQIIAEAHGYSQALYPDKTVEQFICDNVCAPQVVALMKSLAVNPLVPYFGIAQLDKIEAVRNVFDETHSVTAQIIATE